MMLRPALGVLLVALTIGCSSSSAPSSPSSSLGPEEPVSVAGKWGSFWCQGGIPNDSDQCELTLVITQNGPALSGTELAEITHDLLATGTLSGTVNGQNVSIRLDFDPLPLLSGLGSVGCAPWLISAVVAGNQMTGTLMGSCSTSVPVSTWKAIRLS